MFPEFPEFISAITLGRGTPARDRPIEYAKTQLGGKRPTIDLRIEAAAEEIRPATFVGNKSDMTFFN